MYLKRKSVRKPTRSRIRIAMDARAVIYCKLDSLNVSSIGRALPGGRMQKEITYDDPRLEYTNITCANPVGRIPKMA
jgi:hypothetical protein